jgi:hypothetical protein
MPVDAALIAKNLRAFQAALDQHDMQNPSHRAFGIGLAAFDMERMGFDEGEQVLPGITVQADGGGTGNFRVLCDGDHLEELEAEQEEVVEAISTQRATLPVGAPAGDER